MASQCCMSGPRAFFQRRRAGSCSGLPCYAGVHRSNAAIAAENIEEEEKAIESDAQQLQVVAKNTAGDGIQELLQTNNLRLPTLLASRSQRSLCPQAALKAAGSPVAARSPTLESSPVVTPAASFGCCTAPGFNRVLMDNTRSHAGVAAEWMMDTLAVAGNYVGRQTRNALAEAQPHVEQLVSQALSSVSSGMSTAVTSAADYVGTLTRPEKEIWLDPHINRPGISDVVLDGDLLESPGECDDAWARVHAQLHRLDEQVRSQGQAIEEQVRGIEHRKREEQDQLRNCIEPQNTQQMPCKGFRQLPRIAEPEVLWAPQMTSRLHALETRQLESHQPQAVLKSSCSIQPAAHMQSSSMPAHTTMPPSLSFDTRNALQRLRPEEVGNPYIASTPRPLAPSSASAVSTTCSPSLELDTPSQACLQRRQVALQFVSAPPAPPPAPPRLVSANSFRSYVAQH
eukprot:TRINITY_DN33806_c0_g1_i1.p1 TRINITY_DN33806_c0_g1~~TRINITY_DN33806_c0_g1_i1.p1  ORF type:complete len:456 (+),score=77.13 TRINITY_DN33806_c0_g1_i1:53-1420(+)